MHEAHIPQSLDDLCVVNILTVIIISVCDNIDLVAIKSIVGSGEITLNDIARLGVVP